MDNKWTPEPWLPAKEISSYYVYLSEKDYNRAVECVNALAGEKDPAQFVGIGKNYIQQDRDIRKLINADPGESTYDEVYTILNKYKAAEMERRELAEQVKKLSEYITYNT